jgi:outer membrane protein TolC
MKVVQRLDAPANKTISGDELAQLSRPKNPSLAPELSTAPLTLDSDITTSDLNLDLSLDPGTAVPLTGDLLSTGTSLTSAPSLYMKDTLRDQPIGLEDNLLSLPPIGYDTLSTTTLDLPSLLAEDYEISTSPTLASYQESTPTMSLKDIYDDPRAGNFQDDLQSLTKSKNIRKMSLLSTICQSLELNQALRIERLRPEVSNAGIEEAEGEFDTVLEGGVGYGSSHRSTLGPKPKDGPDNRQDDVAVSRNLDYNVGVRGRRPTGTDYSLSFNGNRNTTNRTEPFYSNGLNLNITQNLLRGAGCDVNMISVWTAQNDFVISLYQLQNTLINLVTDVQKAYWDVYLAYETLEIRRKGYQVAREQRERTEEFVRVGRSAPLDALAAQAEEASRVSDLINAISNLKQRQLVLLRLINPENLSTGWRSLIFPNERPVLPTERLVPEERVRLARYYRPDLRQAQIDLANGELQVYRTANGLLPQLDFTIGLALAGNGDTLGDSLDSTADYDHRSYQLGLQFSYPLQNRRANAAHRRANFQKMMADEAVRNYCQIIDVEVRTAILEIERTSRLIYSTKVTEELRRRQLEAETEKFRVGRSTQIEVSQAQRDYVQSQLDRVTAEVANINAYLELYRVEGTALQRRGIQPIYITPESGVPAG